MSATLAAVLWWVPLLLLVLAVAVVALRGRLEELDGLDTPYPALPADADPLAWAAPTRGTPDGERRPVFRRTSVLRAPEPGANAPADAPAAADGRPDAGSADSADLTDPTGTTHSTSNTARAEPPREA
ncbi:hypothetical protein [Miniimonas sp. S16]|uniref:hypothetical protein n=1 Tax=Miniimonas sp. S16 TaxID=2171623 RepID=UPI000D526641|nr:hypothetical protein [Miniimonas sp. S16]